MCVAIIHKCYFQGHLSKSEMKQVEEILEKRMVSEVVTDRILCYQGLTDFWLFYAKIFRDVVLQYCQEEDIALLKGNYPRLLLKYKPLMDKLVNERVGLSLIQEEAKNDLKQQIYENLIRKKETIISQYDPGKSFRNYLWSVIKNDCCNQWDHERKYHQKFVDDQDKIINDVNDEVSVINLLSLDEVFHLFDRILESYTHTKNKLIVCLKVVLCLKINLADLNKLGKDLVKGFGEKELLEISSKLTREHTNIHRILPRFQIVKPFLNFVDQSNTDEQSYWRWTNQQIVHTMNYLNNSHGMNFNRETLKILAEKYFEDFYNK